MKISKAIFASFFYAAASTAVLAHHPQDIYTPTPAPLEDGMGFYIGLRESFTHFGSIQIDGERVYNEIGQRLESSITQVVVGYSITDRFMLQVDVPIIYRYFERPAGSQIERGTEAGLGDVSLSGHFMVWQENSGPLIARWHLLGGVKFPTGDTSRLGEEIEKGHDHSDDSHSSGGEHGEHDHTELPQSGIHGHDLTLGSGSIDGVVGSAFYLRWYRAFLAAEVQYMIRSEGEFDYRFANELTWSGGPGFYLTNQKNFSIGLQANVSGEHKAHDRLRGEKVEDTASTIVYVGPHLNVSWREQLSVEIRGDIPVSVDNSALQIVPDYRISAAVIWWF